MLYHQFVELKVLDFNNYVLDAWGQYDAVPMKFGGCEVRCWGREWSVKSKFVSSHCELHSVRLFRMGHNLQMMWLYLTRRIRGICTCGRGKVLFPCISPNNWKGRLISLDMPLLHFNLLQLLLGIYRFGEEDHIRPPWL